MIQPPAKNLIINAASASAITGVEVIQTLWEGYGKLYRVSLKGSDHPVIVVKHVLWPGQKQKNKNRKAASDRSHQRKVRSYQVEMQWYDKWSSRCDAISRVPVYLGGAKVDGGVLLILEDLDAAGYPLRKRNASLKDAKLCLEWLAHFHARFLGERPEGLWKVGTYWHLATRPDELKKLEDSILREAASSIDSALSSSPYQTFVHGDAKLANFCFSRDGNRVAAVDFQYVGGGCGMKDVAYLISSCFNDNEAERLEKQLLDHYFKSLREALAQREFDGDTDDLEKNWRKLYPIAWTDFHRFIKGWMHDYWPDNCYSERTAKKVCAAIDTANKR